MTTMTRELADDDKWFHCQIHTTVRVTKPVDKSRKKQSRFYRTFQPVRQACVVVAGLRQARVLLVERPPRFKSTFYLT